jgi:DNA mismatch repair protein MutL
MAQFELLEPELKKCGFDAEAGGKDHITLRGVPVLLRQAQFKILLHELCELFTGHQDTEKSDRTSNLLACHAATRAGDTVSTEDAHTVLSKLNRQSIENEKPHGRSMVAEIGYMALDKLFK